MIVAVARTPLEKSRIFLGSAEHQVASADICKGDLKQKNPSATGITNAAFLYRATFGRKVPPLHLGAARQSSAIDDQICWC
jgi:hypothetical protein